MTDSFNDAVEYIKKQRNIKAALYNANLRRYIFDEYDQRLARQNASMPNGADNDGASTSASINNETVPVERSVKIDPQYQLNDTDLLEVSDDSNQNNESVATLQDDRASTPFDENAPNNFENLIGSVDSLGNDPIQNAIDFTNDVDCSPLPPENENDSFEEKEKVRFLNLADEILEVSGDEFDALREEIAYGSDNEDSFEELVKEFDNLVANGIKLPAPIKEEVNDADGQSANVLNPNENPISDLPNKFNPENIGEPSPSDRIRAEYSKCEAEKNTDPVLGNMARLVNVSRRVIS